MPGETAQQLGNFQDNFNYQGLNPDDFGMSAEKEDGQYISTGSSFPEKVATWLGLAPDYEQQFQYKLSQDARDYERANINSARAWEEYLDSTKYQRMVSDLKKAGLNPWLALQGGASASAQGSSTSTGGSSAKYNSKNDDNSSAKVISSLLVSVAKVLAAL